MHLFVAINYFNTKYILMKCKYKSMQYIPHSHLHKKKLRPHFSSKKTRVLVCLVQLFYMYFLLVQQAYYFDSCCKRSHSANFNTRHTLSSHFAVELFVLLCARFLCGYRCEHGIAELISRSHATINWSSEVTFSLRVKSPFKLGNNFESILVYSNFLTDV